LYLIKYLLYYNLNWVYHFSSKIPMLFFIYISVWYDRSRNPHYFLGLYDHLTILFVIIDRFIMHLDCLIIDIYLILNLNFWYLQLSLMLLVQFKYFVAWNWSYGHFLFYLTCLNDLFSRNLTVCRCFFLFYIFMFVIFKLEVVVLSIFFNCYSYFFV
jgi:hypothetical protein